MLRQLVAVSSLIGSAGLLFGAEDARAIVQRSIQAEKRPDPVRRQYIYQEHEHTRQLNGSGGTKSTEDKLFEVSYIAGKEHRRLVQKDGRPLSAQEAKREQDKIDRLTAEAASLSAGEKARREAEADAKFTREFDRRSQVPDAFDFTLVGETSVNGRPAWEINCEPKRDYHGKYAFLLRNVRGRLFIDKQDLHWSRAEAEVLDTVSVGLFLARLSKGSVITFEEVRVNDEVWLPKIFTAKASGRLALVRGLNVESKADFSNYRRFKTDSQVVSTAPAPNQ